MKSPKYAYIFRPDASGRFLSRINRFVIEAQLENGEVIGVHAPNPGRLQELYLPGRRLLLQHSDRPGRKLSWTLAALEHRGQWIPMVSAAANQVAGALVLPGVFPPGSSIRPEVNLRTNRFDFGVDIAGDRGDRCFVEVKSCSLVEEGLGMFPDAPSDRAVGHLQHLTRLAKGGSQAMLTFIVSHSQPAYLAPNYHNDPDFARGLIRAAKTGVRIDAVNTGCQADGSCRLTGPAPKVLLDGIEDILAEDSGWLLCIRHRDDGWLFSIVFSRRNLSAEHKRLERKCGSAKRVFPIRCLSPRVELPEADATTDGRGSTVKEFYSRLHELWAVPSAPVGSGDDARSPLETDEHSAQWLWATQPLENEAFVQELFSLRHRISLKELKASCS